MFLTLINSGEKEIGPKKVLGGFKTLGSIIMKRKSALVQIIEKGFIINLIRALYYVIIKATLRLSWAE